MYSINATTGVTSWKSQPAGSYFYMTPEVHQNTSYIGASSGSKSFFAFSTLDGQIKWSFAGGPMEGGHPTVYESLVLFGSYNHNLYALDKTTGKLVWNFTDTKSAGIQNQIIEVMKDLAFFGDEKGNVFAVNVFSGKQIWKLSIGKFAGIPVSIDPERDQVITCSDAEMFAINIFTGKVAWRTPVAQVGSAVTIRYGTAYFHGNPGPLYAIDCASGKIKFNTSFGAPSTGLYMKPVVDLGTVFVVLGTGETVAVDAFTGKTVWSLSGPTDRLGQEMSMGNGILYTSVNGVTAIDVGARTIHQNQCSTPDCQSTSCRVDDQWKEGCIADGNGRSMERVCSADGLTLYTTTYAYTRCRGAALDTRTYLARKCYQTGPGFSFAFNGCK